MSANDNLKVVDLPKRKQKILSVDDYRAISQLAQNMAVLADDVLQKAAIAKGAANYADFTFSEFYTAKELRDSAQKDFIKAIEEILNR